MEIQCEIVGTMDFKNCTEDEIKIIQYILKNKTIPYAGTISYAQPNSNKRIFAIPKIQIPIQNNNSDDYICKWLLKKPRLFPALQYNGKYFIQANIKHLLNDCRCLFCCIQNILDKKI